MVRLAGHLIKKGRGRRRSGNRNGAADLHERLPAETGQERATAARVRLRVASTMTQASAAVEYR